MTDDRRKQIEEKANELAKRMLRSMCSRTELYSACILMAEWADANPQDKIARRTRLSEFRKEIDQLQSDRKILVEGLKSLQNLEIQYKQDKQKWDNVRVQLEMLANDKYVSYQTMKHVHITAGEVLREVLKAIGERE